MICPKCHSQINEGDKFCQVCGSTIEVNNEPKTDVAAGTNTTSEVNNQVPNNIMNQAPVQPVQPQNNFQQPVNNMNMGNNIPMNNQPEGKKNNTVVYILIGVIFILIAAVIFLVLSKDEEPEGNKAVDDTPPTHVDTEEGDDPTTETVNNQYNKTEVNGYTFYLPKGYSAGYYENVMFYDDDMLVQGIVESGNGILSTLDKEGTKANLIQLGITNVTYKDLTKNNKNLVVFSGIYSGVNIDIVYAEYTKTQFVAAEVHYDSSSSDQTTKDEVYDIISRIEVAEGGYSTTTVQRIPNLKLEVK